MILPGHGQVNIEKALEKRPSVVEYIKKKSPSPKNQIQILYKQDSKVLEYERNPSPKLFQIERDSATSTANPIIPPQRNFVKEPSDAYREMIENKKQSIEKEDKTSEETKGLKEIPEENEEFQGFVRVNTQATEFGIEEARKSGSYISEPLERKPREKKGFVIKEEESFKEFEEKLVVDKNNEKVIESDTLEESLPYVQLNKEKPKFCNDIQVMHSQNIEIKPKESFKINKRPNRNCIIEPQEPLKIPKKEAFFEKKLLKFEKQGNLSFKGIISKEVQTSIDFPATPRFSKEFRSHIFEVQENIKEDYYEIFHNSTSEIQYEIEKKFEIIENELFKIEERLGWAHETVSCLHKLRTVKRKMIKKIHKKPQKFPENKSIGTQIDPVPQPKPILPIFDDVNSVENNKNQCVDLLTSTWVETLELLNNKNIKQAYESILKTGDDIYLLRLMTKTDACFGILSQETSKNLLKKLSGIIDSRFIENIGIQWVSKAINLGLSNQLDLKLFKAAFTNIITKGGLESDKASEIYKKLSKLLINL